VAVANAEGPCNLPEDGRVPSGFSSPSSYLSRWVLPDECQAPADAVGQVGNDDGENIKLEYFSRL